MSNKINSIIWEAIKPHIEIRRKQALCDTCEEEEASRAEGTELFCGRCYGNMLRKEGIIDDWNNSTDPSRWIRYSLYSWIHLRHI